MDLQLANRSVLITGATKGIGEALAYAFAAEGASLSLVARSEDLLDELARKLRSQHRVEVSTHVLDLGAPDASARMAEVAPDIDILINNAGAVPGGTLWQVDDARWREAWSLKVFGYVALARAYYPLMKRRGGGVIVNNIGVAGEIFDAKYICGSSANASLMAFTRALGGRSLDDGVRVVGVNPGPVDSPRFRKLQTDRGDSGALHHLPQGRPASIAEVANAILFLASPLSSYTSGTILTIDGGLSSRDTL